MNAPVSVSNAPSIEQHLHLVHKVARRIARRLPRDVDINDLVGAGTIGLIAALNRFDEARRDQFDFYAEVRIRGAILDELRTMDWLPRSVRRSVRRATAAEHELTGTLGRPPSAGELAARLGGAPRRLPVACTRTIVHLEDVREGGAESLPAEESSPTVRLETDQRRRQLAAAIGRLPLRDQQVLGLYYVEALTMKQIGDLLGITESRVCQLHTRLVDRLRLLMLDA